MTAFRLAYFENWIDPVAEDILRDASGIELVRLSYSDPVSRNKAIMATVHGYQISPGTEIRDPWRADSTFLADCPHLLAICSTGAGYDVINVTECTRLGIAVCNQSGTNHISVAEHAIGMMLSLAKRLNFFSAFMARTQLESRFGHPTTEMGGKTVGIVGIGAIGTATARIARAAFGAEIIAYDPYLSAAEISQRGAVKVDFAELLARSDFVSVHCPLADDTRAMFGMAEYKAMKPSAFFVSTARGGVHDETALIAALSSKMIAGAGVDVFEVEPPRHDHPLLAFDNVVATPHIAGLTVEAMERMAVGAARQWIQIFAGERPPRLVNPNVWPTYAQRWQSLTGEPLEALDA
jgi:D-3-phosphoglycerate dehydrogenase